MNFLKRIAVLFYVTVVMSVGVYLLLYVLNYLVFDDFVRVWTAVYYDDQLRVIVGIVGGGILLFNYTFYSILSENLSRGNVVAFDNPSGRVSVSLLALEDLVRRKILQTPEIKDVKVRIYGLKKGLRVRIKIILRSEVNIPEVTSNVQEQVQKRIHDTIGLEERVDVSIHVGKILSGKIKEKKKEEKQKNKTKEETPQPPTIPFQGYRA